VTQVEATVNRAAESPAPCFGARAIANRCAHPHHLKYTESALLTTQTYRDHLHGGQECMQEQQKPGVVACHFGVPADRARVRIALVGDSHARHWAPALDQLAIGNRWNVVLISKGSCPLNTAPVTTARYPEDAPSCHQWVRSVMQRLQSDPAIDVVVTSASSRRYLVQGAAPGHGRAALEAGFRSTWNALVRAGKSVVVIGDVPAMNRGDIPTCVSRAHSRNDPCWVSTGKALTPDPMLVAAHDSTNRRVFPVDLDRFFCDRSRCHAVIGGVVAWADENHIIGYFARTLAPYIEPAVQRAIVSGHE
jgi:hypothetical protein